MTRDVRFDANRWFAQVPAGSGRDAPSRATRVLLPMPAVDPLDSDIDAPSAIRRTLQDAAYQLE
jgi:hypothetical protein